MRLLLDTHTFLWAYSEPRRLPRPAKDAIVEIDNEVIVSSVSFWEIAIKISIGKLQPIGQHPTRIIEVAQSLGMSLIPLLPEEAANYVNLTEDTHFDPFDRMLIWQAIQHDMILVSGDPEFAKFRPDGLRLLWK